MRGSVLASGNSKPEITHLHDHSIVTSSPHRHSSRTQHHITRRQHLLQYIAAASAIAPTASLLFTTSSAVAATDSTAALQNGEQQGPEAPVYKSFIERDFLIRYPTTFQVVEDDPFNQSSTPAGPRKENPVRVEIVSKNGTAHVSVIQQQVAKLKQTLFQVTDISQLGSIEEVGQLVLPRGSRVVSTNIASFAQAPRDTGTVLGVIERPPVLVYRYEVLLASGQHAYVAVGALLGRILLLGASTSEEEWGEMGGALKEIAESFKLLPK